MLPHTSVAVHTLVKVKLFAQVPAVVVSTSVTVAVPQLSVAVNTAGAGISDAQDTVTAAAGNEPTKVGATVSVTVTVA